MAKAKKPKLNLSRRPKAKSTKPKRVTRPSGGVSTKTRKAQKRHKVHKTAKRIASQIGSGVGKRRNPPRSSLLKTTTSAASGRPYKTKTPGTRPGKLKKNPRTGKITRGRPIRTRKR